MAVRMSGEEDVGVGDGPLRYHGGQTTAIKSSDVCVLDYPWMLILDCCHTITSLILVYRKVFKKALHQVTSSLLNQRDPFNTRM